MYLDVILSSWRGQVVTCSALAKHEVVRAEKPTKRTQVAVFRSWPLSRAAPERIMSRSVVPRGPCCKGGRLPVHAVSGCCHVVASEEKSLAFAARGWGWRGVATSTHHPAFVARERGEWCDVAMSRRLTWGSAGKEGGRVGTYRGQVEIT